MSRRNTLRALCTCGLSFCLLFASDSKAQIPDSISYQGYLTDTGGTPLDTAVSMTFKLYKGATEKWSETHPSVVVTGGVFNVLLGSVNTLDTLAFNEDMNLGITVGGNPETSPRTPLAATAFALGLRGMYAVWSDDGSNTSYNIVGGASNNSVPSGITGATIGGGGGWAGSNSVANQITQSFGTISGGASNVAGGEGSTVGGGEGNISEGTFSTVAGGGGNIASGNSSTVPGGTLNAASGDFSLAAGYRAQANHVGSFVWADSTDADFVTTDNNQFLIRASGGVGIGVNNPANTFAVQGVIDSRAGGFKFPDGSIQTTAAVGNVAWSLTGNAGTAPETDFLGTTDDQPFEIRVDSQRAVRIEPVADTTHAPNYIGGYHGNYVAPGVLAATIAGGGRGPATGGPRHHRIEADYGTVGGGSSNKALGISATVGGGAGNEASGERSTIGGGLVNVASGNRSTVGGGRSNVASAESSTVPGGIDNTAAGGYSFAAGRRAKANHDGSFVWADSTDEDFSSTNPNQFLIRANGGVGIGIDNPGSPLTVNGLIESLVDGFKFPDGSVQASAASNDSTVWSLTGNLGTDPDVDFLGTSDKTPLVIRVNNLRATRIEPAGDTSGGPNFISGYYGNVVGQFNGGATISGGGRGPDGLVDRRNRVAGNFGTVGGGHTNQVLSHRATVGGGSGNEASGLASVIAGGEDNEAYGGWAVVGGGASNIASGNRATVGGGRDNLASGNYATVPGGYQNRAKGDYSFAAGGGANAEHTGSFVWQDTTGAPTADTLTTTGPNQFLARASGGVWFLSAAAPDDTTGVVLASGSGSWADLSSKTSKTGFSDVNTRDYLERLAALDVKEWRYRAEQEDVTHVGPMAEDFYSAFGHGSSDRTITTVDRNGVALAAIKGLYDLVKEQQAEIERMREAMEKAGIR